MHRIKNVLFDLDGTLLNPQTGITGCLSYALIKMGRQAPDMEELTAFIGPPLRKTFRTLLNCEDENLVEKAVAFYRERYSTTGIYENIVYPGVADLLSGLKKDSFKLFIATTKPKNYAEIIVKHFALDGFDGVFGTGMDGSFDNKAELVAHILESESLSSEETVMIGDRREDVLAGKQNRTKTIGVTYGFGPRTEIADSTPDWICDNVQGIGDVIRTARDPGFQR
jgi:phosphoglycolate phosphatase